MLVHRHVLELRFMRSETDLNPKMSVDKKPVYILGLSAYYHDSAAAILRDGEIIAAAQEERFTRKKHDPSFPRNAVAYCLKEAGITSADLNLAAFYEKPFQKFDRIHSFSLYSCTKIQNRS